MFRTSRGDAEAYAPPRRRASVARTSPAPDTRQSLLAGAAAGLLWLSVAAATLPASDGFGVVFGSVAESPGLGELFRAAYVLLGPALVVGLPVALALRTRLLAPLAVAGFEIGVFLGRPGAGDAVGSAASLLWPVGLALIVGLAAVEWAVGRLLVPRLRGGRGAGEA